jgi:glutathione reductase (NADPH)
MAHQVDVVVIGTGSAGSTVAYRCRRAGWSVAIVDKRPYGGTCALRGCDPKKVLVGAAEAVDWGRRMQGKGVAAPGLAIDWPELMRFKASFTDHVPPDREEGFRAAGIATYHGTATFVGPTTVRVGGEALTGRYVVIAAGARPQTVGIPGEEHLVTSERFLSLPAIPRRILFVGGGYIAAEFAHIVARAGAEATIVHRGPRPLERFDPDLVAQWQRATEEAGIRVELGTAVAAVERRGESFVVHATRSGEGRTFEADLVVHAAGRVPELDDLDVAAGGVEAGERGVRVNQYLQSLTNPAVYAGGDSAASPGLPLTPVAGLEGRVIAANLLHGNHATPDYTATPTVVFSIPPLAAVGLSEEAARAQGLRVAVRHEDTSDWYSSRRVGNRYAGYKVLVEEGSGRILGAHLLGPQADEVINIFALAMRFGIPASSLKQVLYSYPSSSDDVSYMV